MLLRLKWIEPEVGVFHSPEEKFLSYFHHVVHQRYGSECFGYIVIFLVWLGQENHPDDSPAIRHTPQEITGPNDQCQSVQHARAKSLENDGAEAIRPRPFVRTKRLNALFDTVSINPATPGVINVYFAPEELTVPLSVRGFLSCIWEVGVNHFHGRFLRCAICAITIFKNTLLYLPILTEGFFEFGHFLVCDMICNEPPPVNPFDFPTMSLEFSPGGIVIIPSVFSLSYWFWGETPPLL